MSENKIIIEEKIYKEEYLIRKEIVNGIETYLIKFFGVTNDVEIEITYEDYKLYRETFSKPLTNYENQIRRKLDRRDLENIFVNVPIQKNDEISELIEFRNDLKNVMKIVDACTATQIRRFKLHFVNDLTFIKIAEIEGVSDRAVSKSVNVVINKLKNSIKLDL